MVHMKEISNLMDQMMKVNIFHSSEKERMLEDDEKTFLDPNAIMDARHRMIREDFNASKDSIWTEAKKLLTEEEIAQSCMKKQQRFLEMELRKIDIEIKKARPKFMKPYTCSRRNLAPSNDEEFWGISGKHKRRHKVTIEENAPKTNDKISDTNHYREDTIKTNDVMEKLEDGKYQIIKKSEVPYISSIKVTIKDKSNSEANDQRINLLKTCFDVLRSNAAERKRLREIRIKIEQSVITKLMRKYFDIWRSHAKDINEIVNKMEERISDEERIEKFVNAIGERQKELVKSQSKNRRKKSLEKNDSTIKESGNSEKKIAKRIVIESPAECRLNAQKKIIEKQKVQLAEQSKIIEELKLKRVQEEIFKANKETVDLAKETLINCGQKTRRSLIHLMQQNGYRDESLNVERKAPDPPRFLLRMEARAVARRKRMKLTEELRKQKLDEQKRKEEDARMEEEQSKRRLQREAYVEARRLRRELEENRRREMEKFRKLNDTADEFYRRYLLTRYVMKPFVKLLEEKRINGKKAEDHYRGKLLKNIFSLWRTKTQNQREIMDETALSFYNEKLLTRTFEQWREKAKETNSKYQVAMDFYDMKLLERYFKSWLVMIVEVRGECRRKEKLADTFYENRLKSVYLGKWKKYQMIVEDIKESERRKEEWRELVKKLIPDFNPQKRGVIAED